MDHNHEVSFAAEIVQLKRQVEVAYGLLQGSNMNP